MLEGLFVTPVVAAIAEALGSSPRHGKTGDKLTGKLAVLGDAKVAQALAQNCEVVAIGVASRNAKKLGDIATLAALDDSIADHSFAYLVGTDVATDDDWQATLARWRRVVRDGGTIVMIDRGHATEASRRALCTGLGEIEQRRAGRSVVTSGVVRHL
ncbi:MAG: hypothetical protein AB7O24_03210 [Kofleriaceae bacterium]